MNIWARRTYFILSVVVFLITATLLVLFATGWRYDRSSQSLGQVGSLSVDSEPGNANIYINDKIIKDKTPLSLNNLIADGYRLSIYKDGYYDWQQNINIEKSKTTYIPHVYLIKSQNFDSLYLDMPINNYKLSNSKKLISIQSGNQLIIHDLEKNIKLIDEEINFTIKNMAWNINDTSLLIETDDKFLLYNLPAREFSDLNDQYNIDAVNYFWSHDEAEIIYTSDNTNFYRINKFQKTIELIFNDKNVIYEFADLYFILNDDNTLSAINKNSIIDTINISNDNSLKFDGEINDFLFIIDVNNSHGYYFNVKEGKFNNINETINAIDFIDANNLLYTNSHEILQINVNESDQNLIIRTSENINQAYWLINDQYVIYTTDQNQIKITEINRPQNNTYEISHESNTQLERAYAENIFFLFNDLGIYKLEF